MIVSFFLIVFTSPPTDGKTSQNLNYKYIYSRIIYICDYLNKAENKYIDVYLLNCIHDLNVEIIQLHFNWFYVNICKAFLIYLFQQQCRIKSVNLSL